MVLEIVGGEMAALIEGKIIAGSHELVATAKANFGFTVAGDGSSFRDLRVWAATPDTAWPKTKGGLAKP